MAFAQSERHDADFEGGLLAGGSDGVGWQGQMRQERGKLTLASTSYEGP